MSLFSVLEAPCIFCDYNGAGYWQSGTHDPACPWFDKGGDDMRVGWFRHVLGKHLASERVAAQALAADRDALLALLREVEWAGAAQHDYGSSAACPSCRMDVSGGERIHRPDCRLSAFLSIPRPAGDTLGAQSQPNQPNQAELNERNSP